jgi:cytochrome c-type biogenesis protein CcmH
MSAFLFAAALVCALTVALIVPPLRRPGGARWFALAVPAGLLAFACGLYIVIGTPAGLEAPLATASQAELMVARLAQHLKGDPRNAKGWLLLARAQTALEHYPEAGQAYARLLALGEEDPNVLVAYADVLAVSQGNSYQGEPERLIERALDQEPQHRRALFLAGGARFERGQFDAAVTRWRLLSTLIGEGDELYAPTASNLADAQARLAAAGRK